MEAEIQALEINQTWDVVNLPDGRKPIVAKTVTVRVVLALAIVRDNIANTKMKEANVVATPLPYDWHAHDADSPLLDDPSVYRRLVGRLCYLNFTRPDLTFSVHFLCRFMQHPTDDHWRAALHVVKYLKGTTSHGLFYAPHGLFYATRQDDFTLNLL
ncbi:hypothetical protein LIER_26321 [Lithospermum erythrorhizon]|uniref:Uncharacterized protein n=1 Tax=Lithospermum erythrorhizon TaxID=34254 RepID=A0AAV3R9F6_LITER